MTFFSIFSGFVAGLGWAAWQSGHKSCVKEMLGGLLLLAVVGTCMPSTGWADTPATVAADEPVVVAADVEGEVVAGDTPGTEDAVAEGGDAGSAAPNASLSDERVEPLEEPLQPRKIERITNVRYPDRDGHQPDWLEMEGHWDEGVYLVAVDSRLHRTLSESQHALNDRLVEAADVYVTELLGTNRAAEMLDYAAEELRGRDLVVDTFHETVHVTTGDMQQSHALLAFDDTFAEDVQARWQEVKSRSRLLQTGIGSGAALLLLTTLFSYFRFDTATRGYYTGRLQFASAGTILAIIVAGVVVAQFIPWL